MRGAVRTRGRLWRLRSASGPLRVLTSAGAFGRLWRLRCSASPGPELFHLRGRSSAACSSDRSARLCALWRAPRTGGGGGSTSRTSPAGKLHRIAASAPTAAVHSGKSAEVGTTCQEGSRSEETIGQGQADGRAGSASVADCSGRKQCGAGSAAPTGGGPIARPGKTRSDSPRRVGSAPVDSS